MYNLNCENKNGKYGKIICEENSSPANSDESSVNEGDSEPGIDPEPRSEAPGLTDNQSRNKEHTRKNYMCTETKYDDKFKEINKNMNRIKKHVKSLGKRTALHSNPNTNPRFETHGLEDRSETSEVEVVKLINPKILPLPGTECGDLNASDFLNCETEHWARWFHFTNTI